MSDTLTPEMRGHALPAAAGAGDDGALVDSPARRAQRRLADRVFWGSTAVTAAITAVWLYFLWTGRDGGALIRGYRVDREAVTRVLAGFTVMTVLWGWLWYGVKGLLLRKLAGFSRGEVAAAFRSRMGTPFDLRALLAAHPERRIRIADMVGRRGRFAIIGMTGFLYVYTRVAHEPKPDFLFAGLMDNLFDALVMSWAMLATYHASGFLGRVCYAAQTRVMDGVLARANCLVIFTLWSVFKFIMVPLGAQLALRFPPGTYATVFAFIWVSYLGADALSEIVGSLFGRQKLRVWGIGEVNRKSLAGTWACFLGSLAICLGFVAANGLGLPWVGLALAVSVSNTVLELASPRGTDDFTMATGNALLCWAFGCLVY
jgi:hypothetical protein